jgi:hypothetical protein
MFRPEKFSLHELVQPGYYSKYGDFSYKFLDPRALMVIDAIRNRYGPMTCNNYHWGGDRTQSGLRSPDQHYYSPTSQHTFGRAFDLIPRNVTAQEIREDLQDFSLGILKLPSFIDSITLEDDVSWLHVDVRNNNRGINLFKP